VGGKLLQKIVVENGVEKIITFNGTSVEDINALDPFAAIIKAASTLSTSVLKGI